MIITILSWCIIASCCLSIGMAAVNIWNTQSGNEKNRFGKDVAFFSGIVLLTVYAQFYSLVAGVGKTAFLLVACVAGALAFVALYGVVKNKKKFVMPQIELWKICASIIVIGFCLMNTINNPEFYDSYLYHIQAIEWIEKYGVVPGLGNLHSRFAYNSSFLSLQALFSFSWLGEALHSLNGCIACFFALYCIITNRLFVPDKRKLSDFLKLVIFPYLYFSRRFLSSPNTDSLAMLFVLYILIKWSEGIESKKDENYFTYLSFFSVFATTLKLSAATFVMLAIFPAWFLVKSKKWKKIVLDIGIGILILLPWMIRSILISGYLVYPNASIDLFSFDWKMPASVLDYDRKEIIVWGREVKDVSSYSDSILKWFPTWINNQILRNKLLILVGLFSSLVLCCILVALVCRLIKRYADERDKTSGRLNIILLYSSILVGFLFWLFSSPLVRYGMIYLLIPAAVVFYHFELQFGEKFNKKLLILVTLCITLLFVYRSESFRLMSPQGYWDLDSTANDFQGLTVYSAADGTDLSDYADFPAVSSVDVLKHIELRGEDFREGFRYIK